MYKELNMSNVTDLKDQINTKTVNLVLLSLVTAGIYPILWLYRNFRIIDKTIKTKTASDSFVIWIAILLGLSTMFAAAVPEMNTRHSREMLDLISSVLNLTSGIFYIIWAFRAKKGLQEYALTEYKIDLRMNGFYTFLLNVLYINYCINDMPEVYRKQQILRSQNKTEETKDSRFSKRSIEKTDE